MLLSDFDLKLAVESGHLGITPYDEELVQPASIDVRLGSEIDVLDCYSLNGGRSIDPALDNAKYFHRYSLRPKRNMKMVDHLEPGMFALASTMEHITLPDGLAARLEGKSSLGRLGLFIHTTAGFIDPGFSGHITLELSNATQFPIRLYAGMKIGQLCVMKMLNPVDRPYGQGAEGSRYQGQTGPTLSRSHVNFKTWNCES